MNRWNCSAAKVVLSHAELDRDAGVQLFEMAAVTTDVGNAGISLEIGAALVFTTHFVTSRFSTQTGFW
jgi:hypothetical protein